MLPEFENKPGKTDDIAYLMFVSTTILVTLLASFGSIAVGLFLLSWLPDPSTPAPHYERILNSRLQVAENLIFTGIGGGLASVVPLGGGMLRSRRRKGDDNDTINIEQSGETTIVSPDLDLHTSNLPTRLSPKDEHPDYEGEY